MKDTIDPWISIVLFVSSEDSVNLANSDDNPASC